MAEDDDLAPLAEGEARPPKQDATSFQCPFCGVLAAQVWSPLFVSGMGGIPGVHRIDSRVAQCVNCRELAYWLPTGRGIELRMVWPSASSAPRAHVDMPEEVKADYEEARSILGASPRGACALLRLANEKLVNDLQPEGRDLNDRIGRLVQAGLPVMVQQSLDAVRVIGNEAVHPGELDLRDDAETAIGLCRLINVVVENRIAEPARVGAIYAGLPTRKVEGIERRDKPKELPSG
jgi:hypothetical protein